MTRRPGRGRAFAAGALLALLAAAACSRDAETPPGPPAPAVQPLFSQLIDATVANETRRALVLRPPHHGVERVELEVPAAAQLHFGVGVPAEPTARGAAPVGSAPVHFELTAITTAEGGGEQREVLARGSVGGSGRRQRWLDANVDLAPWAGRRTTLEFRVAAEGDGRAPMTVISSPIVTHPSSGSRPPNLVIVSLDTLRARSVSAYGYARQTTPFLDAFAERGVLFEDAITTSVTTAPSHMSLITGRYPVNHGVRNGSERKAESAATLAEVLSEAGYHTAAFTENGYLLRGRGFGAGFDEYTENRGGRNRAPGQVRVTFPQAQRWLAQRARPPFFLFVHTYQVHTPYLPPPDYANLFEGDGLPAPDAQMQPLRDAYDREIRFVDDALRELVAALEASGALQDTVVLVVSDHGEEFREHGFFQHGGAVFEETLGVPMIFVGPGVPAGRRVADPVSLIDVLPTALELLDVPRPPDIDGTSLVAAMRGEAPVGERLLFAEAFAEKRWVAPLRAEEWSPPLVAVRAPEGKFVVHRPQEGEADAPRRYDLARDALEQSPQPVEGPQRERVDAWVDDYLRGRLAPHEVPARQALEPEEEERLRALGYL